jgi:CheY-like chemotaxis protein
MIGNAELALDSIPESNPVHENIIEIRNAGMRAAGIVKQLLNFSREADQTMKPIDGACVIRDSMQFLRSTIPASIDIRTTLPETESTILADPIQINQLMINLCANASQAMVETGGTLEVTAENEWISDDLSDKYPELSPGNYLKITVYDTGPGIAPEHIHRIFDPYFTTKHVGKGSGMGLAVVHGIVKNHKGAIVVDSQPGKGAAFTVFIPLIPVIPVIAKKPAIDKDKGGAIFRGNESILLVDDEPSITAMTGQMLKRLGYKIVSTTSALEALELVRAGPGSFDLVITDMTMPQMNGVLLSKKIKDIRSDLPVIVCTGHSPLIDEKRAGAMNIDHFAMKPIVMKDIAAIIRKVLDPLEKP